MDDNEEGSVEVTVMWDRAEYRRLAWTAHRTRNRNNLIAAAVVLYVVADAFTWDKPDPLGWSSRPLLLATNL